MVAYGEVTEAGAQISGIPDSMGTGRRRAPIRLDSVQRIAADPHRMPQEAREGPFWT